MVELVERKEFALARQIVRAGNGIGANVEEALAGESNPAPLLLAPGFVELMELDTVLLTAGRIR